MFFLISSLFSLVCGRFHADRDNNPCGDLRRRSSAQDLGQRAKRLPEPMLPLLPLLPLLPGKYKGVWFQNPLSSLMNNKSAVKSAFAPMKPKVGLPTLDKPEVVAVPEPTPSGTARSLINDEIAVQVSFWLEVVDSPDRQCPAWAYAGNPREVDIFGRKVVAVLNIAHWPAAAAVERKDWRAIKWLVAIAILERLALQQHPILFAVRFHLSQLALQLPRVQPWQTVL